MTITQSSVVLLLPDGTVIAHPTSCWDRKSIQAPQTPDQTKIHCVQLGGEIIANSAMVAASTQQGVELWIDNDLLGDGSHQLSSPTNTPDYCLQLPDDSAPVYNIPPHTSTSSQE